MLGGTQYSAYISTASGLLATNSLLGGAYDVWGDTIGNIYIVEYFADRISKVTPSGIISVFAGVGTGPSTFTSDTLPASLSFLQAPFQVWGDTVGNVFIADSENNRIRKVSATTGIMSTAVGNRYTIYNGDGRPAQNATLSAPQGIWGDTSGNLFVADSGNHRVRMVTAATNIINTLIGTGTAGYNGENITSTVALTNLPSGIWGDTKGNLYYADTNGHRVKVRSQTGYVSTIAGTGVSGDDTNMQAYNAKLNYPGDVFVDTVGVIFIADTSNCKVKQVDPITKFITTIVSTTKNCNSFTGDGGFANVSTFNNIYGIWGDTAGRLFIPDNRNRRVRLVSQGIVTTYAGGGIAGDNIPVLNAYLWSPRSIVGDSIGNLYLTEYYGCRIRKILPGSRKIVTILGSGYCSTSGDGGPAVAASVNYPKTIVIDSLGNLYFTDSFPRVRFINGTTNIVKTIAGAGGSVFSNENSTALSVKFVSLQAIFVNNRGNVYFADSGLYRLFKYNAVTKKITTHAGNGVNAIAGDWGKATSASIRTAYNLLIDGNDKMYFTDFERIRMIDMSTNIITSIAGSLGNYAATCANEIGRAHV